MEAFDQPWKIPVEGGVGAYWGIWDEDRNPKFAWTGPIVGVPSWPLLFAISTLVPLLPLLWFLNRFERFRARGKIFFAGVVQAAASLFVWISYLTVSQYHSAYSATAWVVLLGALGGLLVIGITEAFELVGAPLAPQARAPLPRGRAGEARAARRWSRCTCRSATSRPRWCARR